MILIGLLGIALLLLVAAYYDVKNNRKVPDIVTVLLWFPILLSEFDHRSVIFAFIAMWGLNTIMTIKFSGPMISWGDILGFPAYFGGFLMMVSEIPLLVIPGVLGFIIPIFISELYREPTPVYPYWSFFFGLSTIYFFYSSIFPA